jgi:hypothetical protein
MIKKLLFSGFNLITFLAFCQIPNPGFESVTAGKPNGWNAGPTYSLYPLRDTLAPHSGTHAAAIYGSVPPAYNGAIVMDFMQASARPVALTGWYKFYPQSGDSIVFDIQVWKQGNYAGAASNNFTSTILTGTTNVYTQFSVAINYATYTATTCDSAFISIYPTGNVSQGGYNWAHPNTKAIFDDLAWTTTVNVGIKEIDKNSIINIENIAPNPAKDFANIIYTVSEPSVISIKIYDIAGREVLKVVDSENQSIGRYKAEADLKNLKPGIYFYELKSLGEYKIWKKFVKE